MYVARSEYIEMDLSKPLPPGLAMTPVLTCVSRLAPSESHRLSAALSLVFATSVQSWSLLLSQPAVGSPRQPWGAVGRHDHGANLCCCWVWTAGLHGLQDADPDPGGAPCPP